MTATNGRPGWTEVLAAVERSETRVLSEVAKNSTKIDAIDQRTLNLENDRIRREAQTGTIVAIVGGGRIFLGSVLGALTAIVGMGFFGV